MTESELWAEHSESDWIVTSTWESGLRCRIEDRDVLWSAVHDGADDNGVGNDDDIDDDGNDVEIDLQQGALESGWARGSGAPAWKFDVEEYIRLLIMNSCYISPYTCALWPV